MGVKRSLWQGLVEHEKSPTDESAQMSTVDAEVNPDAKSSTVDDTSKPSSSGANEEDESRNILLHLPQAELYLRCLHVKGIELLYQFCF